MQINYLTVYRPAYGDCTNHGISGREENTTMYLFDGCTPSEALAFCEANGISEQRALIIDATTSCGRPYLKAVPLFKKPGYIGPMFGGNYLHDGDRDLFIPIHDRFETQEEYDILSS